MYVMLLLIKPFLWTKLVNNVSYAARTKQRRQLLTSMPSNVIFMTGTKASSTACKTSSTTFSRSFCMQVIYCSTSCWSQQDH